MEIQFESQIFSARPLWTSYSLAIEIERQIKVGPQGAAAAGRGRLRRGRQRKETPERQDDNNKRGRSDKVFSVIKQGNGSFILTDGDSLAVAICKSMFAQRTRRGRTSTPIASVRDGSILYGQREMLVSDTSAPTWDLSTTTAKRISSFPSEATTHEQIVRITAQQTSIRITAY